MYLLSSQHHRYHALRLRGLRALINQDGAELHLGQAGVPGPHARTTDHISVLHGGREGAGEEEVRVRQI